MKVGYFVETPVEHNLTGGSRSFLNFIEVLKGKDVEPYVVVSEEWILTEELRKRNIPVLTAKMFRPFVGTIDKAKLYHIKYYVKLAFNSMAKRRAKKWFTENGVQLVHINSQFAGIVGCQVAQELHIPYVYHIREYLDNDFGVKFYKESLVTKFIKPANTIIAISRSIKNYYEEKWNCKLHLIYNGLPVCHDTYNGKKKRFAGKTIEIVIVGRVCDAKGQKDAVDAVKILAYEYGIDNIHLNIVGYTGSDTYELDLKTYIVQNGLSNYVTLHPFSNRPFEISSKCDIGLTCSVAEAFGRVTVEYMLASLFTIGANTGGTPEVIVNGESGLLYEQGNSKNLADKIKWAIDNKEKANEMIMVGVDRAIGEFSIETTAHRINSIYKELLG